MDQNRKTPSPGTSRGLPSGDGFSAEGQNFSLVLGGPLFQLLARAHLTDDALLHVRRRMIVISLLL